MKHQAETLTALYKVLDHMLCNDIDGTEAIKKQIIDLEREMKEQRDDTPSPEQLAVQLVSELIKRTCTCTDKQGNAFIETLKVDESEASDYSDSYIKLSGEFENGQHSERVEFKITIEETTYQN